jgi:cytochrome c oxidase assembly protein subunit 15
VPKRAASFFRFSAAVLAATLAVIVWGAYVRATGSGAGCGSHWPACNGEIIPRNPSTETLIEYTHRATSGVAFLLVLVQAILAFRVFPRGHGVRRAATAGLVLMITEALVGAGLVIFEMVAGNTQTARAFWMAAHLLNTFALLAALGLCTWRSRPAPARPDSAGVSLAPGFAPAVTVGLVTLLLVAVTGAVVALGDTLFPAASLGEGLRQDFAAGAHLFVRLRVLHPVLAGLTALYLLVVTALIAARDPAGGLRRLATAASGLVLGQVVVGLANLVLLAPVALQLIHLLLADLLWLAVVVLASELRAHRSVASGPAAALRPLMPGPAG